MIRILQESINTGISEIDYHGHIVSIPNNHVKKLVFMAEEEFNNFQLGEKFNYTFNDLLYVGICPIQIECCRSDNTFYYRYECTFDDIQNNRLDLTLPDEIFE